MKCSSDCGLISHSMAKLGRPATRSGWNFLPDQEPKIRSGRSEAAGARRRDFERSMFLHPRRIEPRIGSAALGSQALV
jgi:hypothetical protein